MSDSLIPRKDNIRNIPVLSQLPKDWGNMLTGILSNWFDFPYEHIQEKALEPKIEISENENDVLVSAEVPGIGKEDIDVEVSADGYLTISGEKREEKKEKSKGRYLSEISYGSFKRTIPLPWDLKFEEAQADFKNGVLSISVPKSQEAQRRKKRITINEKA